MAKNLMTKAPDYPTIRQLFETKTIQDQLKMAAASTVRIDQMARVFLSVIRNNEKLLQSTQQSLLTCLFAFAQLGLSPEPFLGQAYAVPFWNSRIKPAGFEAQFIPGYRGMIVLARRSGALNSLVAQNVFSNDKFEIRFGLSEKLDHIPAIGDRGDFIGTWTKFTYHQGDPTFEFMASSDIEKIKDRSKSKDKNGNVVGPWVTDFEEMAKKTVIKRHMKLAPLSVEDNSLARAAYAEDLALTGGDQSGLFLPDHEDAPIDVEFRDFNKEFDSVFSEYDSDSMNEFLDAVAKGNNESIDAVKRSAVENQQDFADSYEQWKKSKSKATKSAKKSDTKKEKKSTKKKGVSDDKQKAEKSSNSDNELGSDEENEGDQGEDEESEQEIEFDDLIQTDEWQEMSLLKEQYPKFYLKTFKGQTPMTMKDVKAGIESINKMITEEGGDGIPSD